MFCGNIRDGASKNNIPKGEEIVIFLQALIFIVILFGSYLLGSIPTGFIVTKYIKKIDIREYGSSSTGATNVFRALGFKWALLVALSDILKGVIPIIVGKALLTNQVMIVLLGVAAVIGHNWPVFINFKGGRGVATSAGVVIALLPLISLFVILVWLIVLRLSRYVSLASISAAFSFPFFVYLMESSRIYFVFSLILAILVIYQHRKNISRLLAGEESRVSKEKFPF